MPTTPPPANDVIDEHYVAEAIEEMRRQGFPKTDGWYVVILGEDETRELEARVRARLVAPSDEHPPPALLAKLAAVGLGYVCCLGGAVVASSGECSTPDFSSTT